MKRLSALLLAFLLLLAACGGQGSGEPSTTAEQTTQLLTTTQAEEPQVVDFAFTPENMPRMDGSTATRPLGQALAATLLGLNAEDSEAYAQFSGTSKAYEALASGEADLLVVYELPPDTLAGLPEGVQLEMAPIGRDALVFLANTENPVTGLSHQQLVDIYTGDIANWREVGGPDMEIRAFQRNRTSGSQTLMEKLVMGGLTMDEPEYDYVVGDMGGLVAVVAGFDGVTHSIGYNVYYYVSQMMVDPNIRLMGIDGVAPNRDTVRDGSYPYVNDFYAVILDSAAQGSPERILFDWLQGPEGQSLIENADYVSLSGGK